MVGCMHLNAKNIMKILLITVFAAMCLVSSGAQVDDTALRIVKMKLSLIPLDGIRFDESEMGRTEFLRELLKPEFREMRILYALMLAEGEQPRITEFNSRAKTKEAGTTYQEVSLFCCHDGDLALLRKYVLSNPKKKGEQDVPSDGHKPSNSAPSSATTAPADAH